MVVNDQIKEYMGHKIAELQNNSPSSKANLAILRRGLGKDISDCPESWEYIYKDLPKELAGNGNWISNPERAIYVSLTLFAMHQQGQSHSVHNREVKFAEALASIITEKTEKAVIRRFNTLITSDGMLEFTNHLRSMIQLIKASEKKSGFDYVQFASDLSRFQSPDGMKEVKIRWGKQFYRRNMKKMELDGDESNE